MGKYSNSLSISLRDEDGNIKEVKNLATPIPITIEQDKNKPPDNLATEYANPQMVESRPDEYLFYHSINKPDSAKTSIHVKFRPTNTTGNQLLVLFSFGRLPSIEERNIEAAFLVPSHTDLTGKGVLLHLKYRIKMLSRLTQAL